MARNVWTREKEDFIEKNISSMSLKELAKHFDVSQNSIQKKISSMGIKLKVAHGEYWSEEEDTIIQKHFMYAPKDFLMRLLPRRTWLAIYQRGHLKFHIPRESQDKYFIDYNFFSQYTHDGAYMLGFIMADGYLKFRTDDDRNASLLQLELADYDTDILYSIASALKFGGKISFTKRHTAKLQINNTKIIQDLIRMGIPEKDKTNAATFPENLPRDFYPDFVRGLFDGDGSIYNDGGIAIQFLGTQSILEGIRNILPCDTSDNHLFDRSKSGANIFALKFKKKKSIDICNWMYENASMFLKRKHNKFCELKNANFSAV